MSGYGRMNPYVVFFEFVKGTDDGGVYAIWCPVGDDARTRLYACKLAKTLKRATTSHIGIPAKHIPYYRQIAQTYDNWLSSNATERTEWRDLGADKLDSTFIVWAIGESPFDDLRSRVVKKFVSSSDAACALAYYRYLDSISDPPHFTFELWARPDNDRFEWKVAEQLPPVEVFVSWLALRIAWRMSRKETNAAISRIVAATYPQEGTNGVLERPII